MKNQLSFDTKYGMFSTRIYKCDYLHTLLVKSQNCKFYTLKI